MKRSVVTVALLVSASWPSFALADDEIDFFERKIRPVLIERCYGCHSAEQNKVQGGLRLDSKASMMRGGESGPAVVPSNTSDSLLLSAIKYESLEMPPDGRLSEEVISDFERWIERGAVDPRREDDQPRETIESKIDYETGKKFWAFQPPQSHDLPSIRNFDWCQRRLDAFVASKLESLDLEPSPPADPRILLRRVAIDLTGLPPTEAMMEGFIAEPSAEAYIACVDQLLASPQYGERWARLWLDIARYGEDQAHIVGKDTSLCYPNAYLYRDWVIRAFNQDMPYDEFLRQQLAADLLADADIEHVALGFMGLGPKYYRRGSPDVMASEWEDRVDTLTRGILGITVACARCHDHKFDPIGTEDYYALAGVFASTEMYNRPLHDKVELDKEGEASSEKEAMHVIREGEPKDLAVMIRGDVNRLGPTVPRRFLKVLSSGTQETWTEGSGRLQLVEALVDPKNPLTSRVMVNRIWAELFGRGLVATTSNFGSKGEVPSHPELLDDLAVAWMKNGWSWKWLHREIVLSSTYQQSSTIRKDAALIDPENQWLWRMNRKRLSVESWRDSLLAATGNLDYSLGGPSIDPSDPAQPRRTVYSAVSRLSLNRMLAAFDFPDPNNHSDGRAQTVTPLQKLFVLNSPLMVHQAKVLSERVRAASDHDRGRISAGYEFVVQRSPSPEEMELSLAFIDGRTDRWDTWAHVLLATNELMMLD